MWYQQSPAVGDGLGWGLEAAHLAPPRLSGSSGCSQPLCPDRAAHTGDRALQELTWVLLSLQCPGLPGAAAASDRLLALTATGTRPGLQWKPSHGLLRAPTTPGGGQRCTSHTHPPVPAPDTVQVSSQQACVAFAPGGHSRWTLWMGHGGTQAGPLRGRRPRVVKDSPVTGDHPGSSQQRGRGPWGKPSLAPCRVQRQLWVNACRIKRRPVNRLPPEAEVAVAAPWRPSQHGGGGGGHRGSA